MRDELIAGLSEDRRLLLEEICEKSKNEYHLPSVATDRTISFGAYLGFPMFRIIVRDGCAFFEARARFLKSAEDNIRVLELVPMHKALIFEAIEEVYESYLPYRALLSEPADAYEELAARWERLREQVCLPSAAERGEPLPPAHRCGEMLSELLQAFDGLLGFLTACSGSYVRAIEVFCKYMARDDAHQAQIASDYGNLSRQRISQLCRKGKKQLQTLWRWVPKKDTRPFSYLAEITRALEEHGPALLPALALAAEVQGKRRKLAFFFELLLGAPYPAVPHQEEPANTEQNGSTDMTELEKTAYAKTFIDKLANGINPLDDTLLPEDSIVNHVRLARCFFYVSQILEKEIKREGRAASKPKPPAIPPFSITQEELKGFEYAPYPITATALARKINALVSDKIAAREMKKFSYRQINYWLRAIGMIEWREWEGGKTKRFPTPEGEAMGLVLQIWENYGRRAPVIYFTEEAQRFILDNIEAVIAAEKGTAPQNEEEGEDGIAE